MIEILLQMCSRSLTGDGSSYSYFTLIIIAFLEESAIDLQLLTAGDLRLGGDLVRLGEGPALQIALVLPWADIADCMGVACHEVRL